METVLGVILFRRFYGKISVETVLDQSWRKHGKSNYQTISILILILP